VAWIERVKEPKHNNRIVITINKTKDKKVKL